MKRVVLSFLAAVAVFLFGVNPVLAGDAAAGAAVFSANCASCHAGGKNLVNAAKSLSKADLEKYDMYDIEKIKTQVTKGKMAMPSFLGRLNEQQIEDVATYVLSQADKGW